MPMLPLMLMLPLWLPGAVRVSTYGSASMQGLTLVHFSAQLKRILWDRGAIRGRLAGVQEMAGGIKVYHIRKCSGCILCQKRLKMS